MDKLLITNIAYGDMYSSLFCNQHLKSFLDESNIPAVKDRVEYLVFSDAETIPKLHGNQYFQQLTQTVKVELFELKWPEQHGDLFNHRYDVLLQTFKISVQKALDKNAILSAIVADLVCARGFLPKVLSKIDEGHGAVFVQPPRCAADVVAAELDRYPRAMHADDLWRLCYANMHHLWTSCHWDASLFTKLPFHLLWNSYAGGLLCRSFSITPVVFRPKKEMLERRGMIDGDIPELCDNPYWCEDWTDAPIMGVEPLFCYYPSWANHRATTQWVKQWSNQCIHPSQKQVFQHSLFYPDKATSGITADIQAESDKVIQAILG